MENTNNTQTELKSTEQIINKDNNNKQEINLNSTIDTAKHQTTIIKGYVNNLIDRKGSNGEFQIIKLRVPYKVYNINTKTKETAWVEVNIRKHPELIDQIKRLSHNDCILVTGEWHFYNYGTENKQNLRLGFNATDIQLVKKAKIKNQTTSSEIKNKEQLTLKE